MPSPDPIRLELKVDSHGDHIAGRIGADDRLVPFTGWLELIAAIEVLSHATSSSRPLPSGEHAEETSA